MLVSCFYPDLHCWKQETAEETNVRRKMRKILAASIRCLSLEIPQFCTLFAVTANDLNNKLESFFTTKPSRFLVAKFHENKYFGVEFFRFFLIVSLRKEIPTRYWRGSESSRPACTRGAVVVRRDSQSSESRTDASVITQKLNRLEPTM